jgi:O-antigen ligase
MNTVSTPDNLILSAEKKSRVGWIKLFLTVAIAIMIGVLSTPGMYPNDAPPSYRLPVFAVLLAVIFFLSVGRIGMFSKRKLGMLFLWAGFSAMSLISGLIHEEELMGMLWMSLGVPYLIFCVFPQAAGRHGNVMVLVAIVLAYIPYVAASLILYPISNPYAGVFSNPNAFGMAVVTMSAALFGLLRGAIETASKSVFHWLWIILIFLILTFLLILLSSSRTSLITYIILALIFAGSLFFNVYKHRWWIAVAAFAVLGALSFVLFPVFSDDARNSYLGRIVEKMETKLIKGDVSGGRFMIWKTVVNDVQLFGRGSYSFVQNYGTAAHNTYVMVLGGSGPLALVFLVAVHGMAIVLAYRRVVNDIRQDGYAIGPLLVIMNYIVLGLAELVFGILGNGINMSFLLMIGILVNEGLTEEKSMEYAENRSMAPIPSFAKR